MQTIRLIPFDKEDFAANLREALKRWYQATEESYLLEDLLLVQQEQDRTLHEGRTLFPRLITNQILTTGLAALTKQDPAARDLLERRYVQRETADSVGYALNVSRDTVNRLVKDAVYQLRDILWRDEMSLRTTAVSQLKSQLDQPQYTELFGRSEQTKQLIERLMHPTQTWIAAIVGLGGIGKTALAHATALEIIHRFRFKQVAWVRTNPITFFDGKIDHQHALEMLLIDLAKKIAPEVPASAPTKQRERRLQQVLNETPHLVVIDNLETEGSTAFLLDKLLGWANPSKFLLTTRIQPSGLAEIFPLNLTELPLKDAGNLIRAHAHTLGLQEMVTATEAQIASIYKAAGGNPLALRLVVDLARMMSLPEILADLPNANTVETEQLYRRIYHKVWSILPPPQRTLLQAMPIVSETGGTRGYLQSITGLDDAALWGALSQLRTRSLIEVRGTLEERRYGIHRLTATFLQTDINRWV